MKRRAEAIRVRMKEGVPYAVWRGAQRLDVTDVLDSWVVQGRWWVAEEHRLYFRLATRRGVLEVYRRGQEWWLSRVVD